MMDKIKKPKLYKTLNVFLWKWLKPVYDSGSISTLVDFDSICNNRDNFCGCFLLTSSNSFFAGLISLHLVLFWMFGLWSLTVIKTGRLELHFLFSLGLSDSAIFSVYLSILCLKSDSHLPNFFLFICFNDSPWKMTKNVFYFILKALFVLKIFKFLPWLFGHVEETVWLERCG